MVKSLIWLTTAEQKDAVNLCLQMMQQGPDNLSIPASPTGQEPATHYYGSYGGCPDEDAEMFLDLAAGNIPESLPWGEPGFLTIQEGADAMAAFVVDVKEDEYPNHETEVLSGLGIQRIE